MPADPTVERFRRALMDAHHHDWSMTTISEAAHICASVADPTVSPERQRKSFLSTLQLARLEHACSVVADGLGDAPYLVGTATESANYRDVDLRVIMDDEKFDRLFGPFTRSAEFPGGLWGLLCLTVSHYLSDVSGLPVDFQIQRMTDANEKFGGKPRNPMGHGFRQFAGGGDATDSPETP